VQKRLNQSRCHLGCGLRCAQGIVLDAGPQVLRDVAMATNFCLSMGYNFGCVIASDILFDSRWFFGLKLSDENITEINYLRVVAMATNFRTQIAITGFV